MITPITQMSNNAPLAIFPKIIPYLSKVAVFAKEYFFIISNLCLVGLGFKELTFKSITITQAVPNAQNIWRILWNEIYDLKLVQGCLYIISGILGGLAAAHYHGLLNLGSAAPFLEFMGNGLFIIGNLLSLKENIETLIHGLRCVQSLEPNETAEAKKMIISSLLGIINNLSYLLALAAALFGAPVATAFILGIIGFSTGCIKIFLDCFLNVKAGDSV